ncbi:MAG TPA: hypothetical protein VF214_02135 [Edaphobacter sp.]
MHGESVSEDRLLDERVVNALERVPEVDGLIPADFAARVAERVPVRKNISVTPTYYGRKMMVICGVVLLVLLALLAAKGMDRSTIGAVVEWCLVTQFIVLAIWLGTRRWGEG